MLIILLLFVCHRCKGNSSEELDAVQLLFMGKRKQVIGRTTNNKVATRLR